MFNSMKNEVAEDSIYFERLRTIFFLSKYLHCPVSVLLQQPHERLTDSKVVFGVVDYLGVNGDSSKPIHQQRNSGAFGLGLNDNQGRMIWYDFKLVRGISLEHHTDPLELARDDKNLNTIQHLRPFTGFGDIESSSSESFYYNFLMRMKSSC
jgi:hypothetical protein